MNLSAPFIRRPIGTILLTIGIAMSGMASFLLLPVAPLPQVDFPTIVVTAAVPGASPSTMSASVAAPLEKHLGTISGITEITSRSGIGSTNVILQFDLSRSINGAARDVQAALNAARIDLPAALKSNPTYRKINPADAPVLILALTSPTLTPPEIYDAVSNILQQRLLQIEGVGDVEMGGAALPAVRVDLNPLALTRFGISSEDVRAALAAISANRPRGAIEGEALSWQIYTTRQGRFAADYKDLVVAWRNGAAVRLADVAEVADGPEDVRTMGLFNGQPAVMVLLSRQPGANIVATVDAVKAELPGLEASLPAGISLHVASDRTKTIRASLKEVETALVVATLLVVAVVSFFLRSLRATVIPLVSITVSLLGTLAIMYLIGFSLNNLSLMALTIATGFVADDAIVVMENIARHIEKGESPRAAALNGARDVGFTVLSISVGLIAAFIPLLFMGGIVGRIFAEFAVTMTIAIAISLVVSLTTTPMLAALLLRADEKPNRLSRAAEYLFGLAQRRYAKDLDRAMAHPKIVLLAFAATIAGSVYLIQTIPKGFFPEQDTGALIGGLRADQSISFRDMQNKLRQIERIVRSDPGVESVVAFTGGTRAGSGFMSIALKPVAQRDSSRAIIARLRPQLARVTGLTVFLSPVQDMRIGARSSNSAYQYSLKADDPDTLWDAGQKLVAKLRTTPGLTDVDIDQQRSAMSVYVQIDRDRAARLGVTMQAINAALYNAFGQRQVATIYADLNQYRVVLGVGQRFMGAPEALENIYVPIGAAALPSTASGTPRDASAGSPVSTTPRGFVPLSQIARWAPQAAPASIAHEGGQPAATLSFAVEDGVTLGEAAELLLEAQRSLNLPASVHGGFAGSARTFAQTSRTMPLLILAAIAAIYIVLGILYESWIHPLTVLTTLPSAGVGAFLALLATGTAFDLIGVVGIILLIGIVKKNAIMIIDFALDAERARGLAPRDAIREAALLRFRPILMTTLAAIFGAIPLAIGFGDGAELRRPLGIAIVGGMIASQFLTLLITPVVYLALDRLRLRRTTLKPVAP